MSDSPAISGSLSGGVEPVSVTATYRAGMAVTAALMVLLPLFFGALVVGLGVGIWAYLTMVPFSGGELHGKALALAFCLYLTPPGVAIVLLVALLKPFFAPPLPETRRLRLDRRREPLLFDFVDRLAWVLQAPAPVAIELDVEPNASASLRDVGKGGRPDDEAGLVLTLGAPLVRCLTLAQLAGIMAHELGHFKQANGLRSIRTVRRINLFFARLALDRDSFDAWLEENSAGRKKLSWAGLFLSLARGVLWATRKLFLGLLWSSHALSSFQLRQMELDADRYEARLVGAEVFASTMEELGLVQLAHHHAVSQLGEVSDDGRLPESIPGLVMRHRESMGEEVRLAVRKASEGAGASWLSTHPADQARLASIRRETSPPVFRDPGGAGGGPARATELFEGWERWERLVTRAHYCTVIGEAIQPSGLISLDEIDARLGQSEAEAMAFESFFAGEVSGLWPLAIGQLATDASVEGLEAVRRRAAEPAERLTDAVRRQREAWSAYLRASQAACLLAAGLEVDGAALELPGVTEQEIEASRRQALERVEEIAASARELERVRGSRLAYSLGMLADERVAGRVDPEGELRCAAAELLDVELLLGSLFGLVRDLMRDHAVFSALARELGDRALGEKEKGELVAVIQSLWKTLRQLSGSLADVDYPFEASTTLADHVVGKIGEGAGIAEQLAFAGSALERFHEVYFRGAARLAFIAWEVEAGAEQPDDAIEISGDDLRLSTPSAG